MLTLTDEEFEEITRLATAGGWSVRAFMVRRALAPPQGPGDVAGERTQLVLDYTRTLGELHRVGVNLNQVAAGVNRVLVDAPDRVTGRKAAVVIAAAGEIPQVLEELRAVAARVVAALAAVQRDR